MRTVAIIQARVGSTRFPNKVLTKLNRDTALDIMLSRVKRCTRLDDIIVAIPDTKNNDLLSDHLKKKHIECFRGSEHDVLKRFAQCQTQNNIDITVRLTADCPFIEPKIIDNLIEEHVITNADYSKLSQKYAEGLDVEVINAEAIYTANQNATRASEREHVTLYLNNYAQSFYIHTLDQHRDDSDIRITFDTVEDHDLLNAVAKKFSNRLTLVTVDEIISFIRGTPSLYKINSHIVRNHGLLSSIIEEKISQKH
ncbi:hypothetical protein OAT72_00825 [Alphaproteobacteria bacterium]|nr:hypothetical protein [Alphaproteobacteria bacterium]